MSDMRERVLAVARERAQAQGYGGLSFRELAAAVGIKSASLHYHFPTKSDLGAALARRYAEDAQAGLARIAKEEAGRGARLRRYTQVFRRALENGNRMCLCGFMAAEYAELPESVRTEVAHFAEVNVAWLAGVLAAPDPPGKAHEARALAIFAAVGGAQLAARGRGDVTVYDAIIETYRTAGLIPD